MKSNAPAWHAGALLAVVVVLLGVALGRPGADHFRTAEVPQPVCAQQGLEEQLKGSDLVLSGTASAVTTSYIDIKPDHYYFGAPDWAPMTLRIERHGWDFGWQQGRRYIVASFHGNLQECGATQQWNQLAADAMAKIYH